MNIHDKAKLLKELNHLPQKVKYSNQILFTEYLPFILLLKNNGSTDNEVVQFLKEKCNFILNRQYVSKFLSDYRKGILNNKYLDLVVLFCSKEKSNELKLNSFSTYCEFEYYITLRNINYPKELELTREKLTYIKSPLGMLIAKRIMGWYDINDVVLTEIFEKSDLHREIYQKQLSNINNIIEYFQNFYFKIRTELQNKNFKLFEGKLNEAK